MNVDVSRALDIDGVVGYVDHKDISGGQENDSCVDKIFVVDEVKGFMICSMPFVYLLPINFVSSLYITLILI